MASTQLRSQDIGIEREEEDGGAGEEIPKVHFKCGSQNAMLYEQGGVTEREAKRKSKDKSFKELKEERLREGKSNSKEM